MNSAINELAPSAIPQACQLFEQVFGHAISPEQWRWKYLQGPRLGGLNLVARAASGELLGHIGASIFQGTVAGNALPMAQVCDVMVQSSARGGLAPPIMFTRV